MSCDIVARLRDYHATVLAAPPYYRELTRTAADEIERLREERDHARREVCELSARCVRADYFLQIKNPTHLTPKDVAQSRGLDCFKEER